VKNRQIKTYQVKNRSDTERTVLIEHPVNHAFRLAGDKPKETASDVYRFELKVPAGTSKNQVVVEEREDVNSYSLVNSGDEQIKWFLAQPTASKKVLEGIQRAQALRMSVAKTTQDLAEAKKQLEALVEDQKRIRANIKELPSTSKAYKRLVEKIDEQEPQIEKYQADIKGLLAQQNSQQKAFDDFLAAFTAE
jgi:chromosome segregation ATPase